MNQVIVVLGGTSGVGLETSKRMAKNGFRVIATGRDPEKLSHLQKEFEGQIQFVSVDSSKAQELNEFFQRIGKIDHLVLTLSGAKGAGLLKELDLTDLRAGFEAKFWAQLQSVKCALPYLGAKSSITFVTAVSAKMANPGTVGLAAINGAIDAMVRPLAAELAPMRVNAVSPGVVNTAWWNKLPAEQKKATFEQYAKASLVGRVGEALDLAQVIELLVSNTFMTGQVLVCDGGLSLRAGG